MTGESETRSLQNSRWRSYAVALVPSVLIFLYRAWFVHYDWMLSCAFAVAFLVIIAWFLIGVLFSRRLGLIVVCLIGIAVSVRTPRLVPEQIHLVLFRTKYQAVVELARNQQLGHRGICQFAYALPDEYTILSHTTDECIFVEYEPALVVVFEPLFYRNLLVYAETPEAVQQYISCGGSDGLLYCELEEHWYFCAQDWN